MSAGALLLLARSLGPLCKAVGFRMTHLLKCDWINRAHSSFVLKASSRKSAYFSGARGSQARLIRTRCSPKPRARLWVAALTFREAYRKMSCLRGLMKTIRLLLFVLSIGLIANAADTKPVTNKDGNCVASVPSTWTVQPNFGIATSPDKKSSIVVSSPNHGLSSLADVEQLAPTLYKNDKVTKSSASEFEMEGTNGADKPNFYRSIPAGAKLCIAEITYQSGTPAEAKAIIETLKAK